MTLAMWLTIAATMVCLVGHIHCVTEQAFFTSQSTCPGRVVDTGVYCPATVPTGHRIKCSDLCRQDPNCQYFVLDAAAKSCHLCTVAPADDCSNTVLHSDVQAYIKTCAGLRNQTGACVCPPAYGGDKCQLRMTDCPDWENSGQVGSETEARWIYPSLAPAPFRVWCDDRWSRTLVMFRSNTTLDFYRNWTDYAEGFGDVEGDHWLGLKKLHWLTNSRNYHLFFQLNVKDHSYFQQYYWNFTVTSESQNFAMDFTSTNPLQYKELGDCLSDVKGKSFSTYDADHDDISGNCAERHHSGWWFGSCTLCNPTGVLKMPADSLRTGDEQEVFWTDDLGQLAPESLFVWVKRM